MRPKNSLSLQTQISELSEIYTSIMIERSKLEAMYNLGRVDIEVKSPDDLFFELNTKINNMTKEQAMEQSYIKNLNDLEFLKLYINQYLNGVTQLSQTHKFYKSNGIHINKHLSKSIDRVTNDLVVLTSRILYQCMFANLLHEVNTSLEN